jgi:hypothetical protein
MCRSYPIWNEVEACNYQSSKSWGSKDCMTLNQKIGSSATNSHDFAEIRTTRREITLEDGTRAMSFRLTVDGEIIKQALFTIKNGRADQLIKIGKPANIPTPDTVDNRTWQAGHLPA